MKKRYSVKKDLIILSSIVIAAILTITVLGLVILSRKESSETPSAGVSFTGLETEPTEVSTAGDGEELPTVETAAEEDWTEPEYEPESEPVRDAAILARKEGAKEGYLNRCVFLGDSRTVAMVDYVLFNDDAVLAQVGISHQAFASNTFINYAGREYTLNSYLASHQAPVIYIALGVNGIEDPSEEHYKKTYLSLIDSVTRLAPGSQIVLMSIGPVDDHGPYRAKVQNAKIDRYNGFLLETAREKGLFYLDTARVLKGADGQLKREYDGGDGLHYSKSGYEAVYRYIVEHPVPGVSDAGEYVVRYIAPDPSRMKTLPGENTETDKDRPQESTEGQQEPQEEEDQEDTEEDEEEDGDEEEDDEEEDEDEDEEGDGEGKKKGSDEEEDEDEES